MSLVGLATAEQYFWHDPGTVSIPGWIEPIRHIDGPIPKRRLLNLINVAPRVDLARLTPEPAQREDLQRVHRSQYVDQVASLSSDRGGEAGEYCPIGVGTFEIAKLAAGGVICATSCVLEKEVQRAFALVRPAGHHAEPAQGRGYCVFNNIAVALEWARCHHAVDKFVILDWDVHHGNGVQSLYWASPQVLTISIHQDQLYPADSGNASELGGGKGYGYNINLPLPPGSGLGAYDHVFETVIEPAILAFDPELIFVACGFDAGMLDPLGRMMLTSGDFSRMARRICAIADNICDGRIVFATEGGYSDVYVPLCGLAVLQALMGQGHEINDPYMRARGTNRYDELQPYQHSLIDSMAVSLRREVPFLK